MGMRNVIKAALEPEIKFTSAEAPVVIDMMQMRILHALYSGMSRDLVVLKGGLAMQAIYNSSRSTQDIDMAADPDVNMSTLNKHIHNAINQALRSGLLEDVSIREQDLNHGGLSPKWHINGRLAGSETPIHIKLEISRRDQLPEEAISRFEFTPDEKYGIKSYTIRTYSPIAMAASKVTALLDPGRTKPRDLYDLYMMIEMKVEPPVAMLAALGKKELEIMLARLWCKVGGFKFKDFQTEVAPSLPHDIGQKIKEVDWLSMQLEVAEHIESWIQSAMLVAEEAIPRRQMRDQFDSVKSRTEELLLRNDCTPNPSVRKGP